jgi:hypothetical protein
MGGYERRNHASSTVLKPSSQAPSVSSTEAPSPARITLPSDLSGSLKYLDDAQLQQLHEAVATEINRRNQGASETKIAPAAPTGKSPQRQSSPFRRKKIEGIREIPEGKANLIRASFGAGVKPAAIARTFRIPRAMVDRLLNSTEKPKR